MAEFVLDWSRARLEGVTAVTDGKRSMTVAVRGSESPAARKACEKAGAPLPDWRRGSIDGQSAALSVDDAEVSPLRIRFERPVMDLAFRIFDVDSARWPWDDRVRIVARDGAGRPVETEVSQLTLHHLSGRWKAFDGAWQGPLSIGADARDSMTIHVPGPVQSLEIRPLPGDADDLTGAVGIGPLRFEQAPSLPDALLSRLRAARAGKTSPGPRTREDGADGARPASALDFPRVEIAVPGGMCPLSGLRPCDPVLTRLNGAQPLRQVLLHRFTEAERAARPDLVPVMIRAGALGEGLPRHDTVLAPLQRLRVPAQPSGGDHVLVAARDLTGLPGIAPVTEAVSLAMPFFDTHEVICWNGLWVECHQPACEARDGDARRDALLALFPRLAPQGRRAATG